MIKKVNLQNHWEHRKSEQTGAKFKDIADWVSGVITNNQN